MTRTTRTGRLLNRPTIGGCIILLLTATWVLPAHAINFYTGGRMAEGFCLSVYPYWYSADKKTDKSGDVVTNKLGLDKYGVFLSGTYYTGNLLLNAVAPVTRVEVRAARDSESGLGDVQFRVGYFLPVKVVTMLPAVVVKFPTGDFDKNRSVNVGDGQTDILAELYFNKLFDRFSIDWVLKYSRRLYNHDTDIKPGDEFITEGLVTYKISDTLRVGPSVAFLSGGDFDVNGKTVRQSAQSRLSLGGEMFYKASPKTRISVAALKDIYTRNSAEGVLMMGRVTIPF